MHIQIYFFLKKFLFKCPVINGLMVLQLQTFIQKVGGGGETCLGVKSGRSLWLRSKEIAHLKWIQGGKGRPFICRNDHYSIAGSLITLASDGSLHKAVKIMGKDNAVK